MPENNYLSEAYDQRPEVIIHDRLRHSGSVQPILELAQQKNYSVSFSRGPFWKDLVIKEEGRAPANHTIQSAIRYISTGK